MTDDPRRVVVLAHGKFPDRAKTATGVMKYGTDEVVAVLDRDRAGQRVADCRADLPDAPIVGPGSRSSRRTRPRTPRGC